jgi:5-methylcytosine-specific restriction endonuclease McrA
MDEESHKQSHGTKHPVHHIVPARQFDDPRKRNHEDNLVTLCRPHHNKAETMAPLLPSGIEQPVAD